MKPGNTGQSGHIFVDFGIVFHGTGSQRVEPHIDAEIAAGKRGIMAHQIHFSNFGKIKVAAKKVIGNQPPGRYCLNITFRHTGA